MLARSVRFRFRSHPRRPSKFETGYAPLRSSAGRAPAPGFSLSHRADVHGLIVYRFLAPVRRSVSERTLRGQVITLAHPEVLVGAGAHVTSAPARG